MKGLIGYQSFWLPFAQDIRLLNCPDPPSKEEIAMELVTVMRNHGSGDPAVEQQFQATATEIRKNPPNAFWMLAMLSTAYP